MLFKISDEVLILLLWSIFEVYRVMMLVFFDLFGNRLLTSNNRLSTSEYFTFSEAIIIIIKNVKGRMS